MLFKIVFCPFTRQNNDINNISYVNGARMC